jgi:tetrapyrrole methylase family protein/MazG family protein
MALEDQRPVFLRTARHPSAELAGAATSFDHLYERAATVEDVYPAIVEALVGAAREHGSVVYAVPGSPAVAERTVELLRSDDRVLTEVLPAVSFADLAFASLRVDPLAAGARIVDGHRFELAVAGERGPFLVGQCDSREVLSLVKLALGELLDEVGVGGGGPDGARLGAPGFEITVLQRLGLADEHVARLSWDDLDRAVEPDHLTSVWVPALPLPFAGEMTRLDQLGRALRERCPWDRQQTHASLARYMVEECYEAVEAIEELGDDAEGYEHLEEELGDVLFQVVFHSRLAAEEGQFTLADVARRAHDKLVARHPHVFGTVDAETAEDVARNWEQLKRAERSGRAGGLLAGVPRALPSLLYAYKIQSRASSVGFDWADAAGAMAKVTEELGELIAELGRPALSARPGAGAAAEADMGDEAGQGAAGAAAATTACREELGDLLFAVVNVARHLRTEPETALREATNKFRRRFEGVEALAAERGTSLDDMSLEAMDRLWDEVKANERAAQG